MKPIFVIQIAGTELNRHPTEPLATINFANTSVALPVSFTAILLSKGNYTTEKENHPLCAATQVVSITDEIDRYNHP